MCQTEPPHEKAALSGRFKVYFVFYLKNANLSGLVLTVGAFGNDELNLVMLFEVLEALSLDFAEVDEEIFAAFLRDEAVTFFRAEPLDCTCRHVKPNFLPRRANAGDACNHVERVADNKATVCRTYESRGSRPESAPQCEIDVGCT